MPRRAQTALSYLQAPLDEILGKQSHIRMLRVLSEYEQPIPPFELARQTRLDLSGVLRAIESLVETGIVSTIGVGRGRVIRFNTAHHFAPVLQQLFDTERRRRQDLVDELQRAAQTLDPMPSSVWIEGPHSVGMDTVRDALHVGALVHVRNRQVTTEGFREPLREIERKFGLTVDLVLRTMADLATLTPEQTAALCDVLPIWGVPPINFLNANHAASVGDGAEQEFRTTSDDSAEWSGARESHNPQTHAQLDLASRRSAEVTAREIKRDPRIVERAKRWLEHRLPQASEAERHELREWAHILTMPPHRIGAFLLDPGERATRLRQTSPFLAVSRTTST